MLGRLAHWMVAGLLGAVLAACASQAEAWGSVGHRVTAIIAYNHLTPVARAKIDALLADSQSNPELQAQLEKVDQGQTARGSPRGTARYDTFPDWAMWADRYRLSHRDSAGWHFIDLDVDHPSLAAACPALVGFQPRQPPPPGECIVTALYREAAAIRDPRTSEFDRIIALRFLMHFVGDIHQPLHTADRGDEGGNCVQVRVGSDIDVVSLHGFWDTYSVALLGSSPELIAAGLDNPKSTVPPRPEDIAVQLSWTDDQAGWAAAWALESNKLAHDRIYPGARWPPCGTKAEPIGLSSSDYATAKSVASSQLLKAGLRLANLLNALLA